jgi:hypothetical protein
MSHKQAISALLFLDSKGKPVLYRDYRYARELHM